MSYFQLYEKHRAKKQALSHLHRHIFLPWLNIQPNLPFEATFFHLQAYSERILTVPSVSPV
jgi:hypothetical protein